MARKEGRCLNCGALLMIDPKQEQAHCLFCNALFDTKTAFQAHATPDAFTFPNEPQPDYDGPLRETPVAPQVVPPVAKAKSSAKRTAKDPVFVPRVTHVPDATIPMRAKLWLVGIIVVCLGLFAAILLPLTMNRDRQRREITTQFNATLNDSIKAGEHLAFFRLDNGYAILALNRALNESEANAIFSDFARVRAQVMGQGAGAETVTLRLVTPSGGFLLSRQGDKTSCHAYD